ncbi:hypothetical protein [Streptomyces sp. NPDC007355]|uniref:hypothetical protein n=1 Tax=Streptomyces sp. NPDC007355 TaxID=3364778 RepID=UPI003677F248
MAKAMDEIMCKCGALTYEQHLMSDKPGHTYKSNKVTSQVRTAPKTAQQHPAAL